MISIEEAIEIAKKRVTEYPVNEVMDLQDRWGIAFDAGKVPPPGSHTFTVDKISGKIALLPIPPIENLRILSAAKVVWSAGKD